MGMIITRRPGESVDIGQARVTVVRLRNGRVKLSVEAPAEVRIEPRERTAGERGAGGPGASTTSEPT